MFWLFFCRFAAGEGWSDRLARTLKVPICPSGPHVHRVPPGSRYRCKLPLQVLAQGSARLHTLSHFLTISCLIEPIFFFLTSTTPDKQNTQRTRVPLAQKKKKKKTTATKNRNLQPLERTFIASAVHLLLRSSHSPPPSPLPPP